MKDKEGITALMWAVRSDNVSIAKWLINPGKARIDEKDTCEYTALMFAAELDHLGIVKYLIGAKADVNVISQNKGRTALMLTSLAYYYL